MKKELVYKFDPKKNSILIEERGVSFEEVIAILNGKGPLDILIHPNENKYKNQKIYIIEMNQYIYMIPFIEDKDYIFLKTIFPSRKANKIYRELGSDDNE